MTQSENENWALLCTSSLPGSGQETQARWQKPRFGESPELFVPGSKDSGAAPLGVGSHP